MNSTESPKSPETKPAALCPVTGAWLPSRDESTFAPSSRSGRTLAILAAGPRRRRRCDAGCRCAVGALAGPFAGTAAPGFDVRDTAVSAAAGSPQSRLNFPLGASLAGGTIDGSAGGAGACVAVADCSFSVFAHVAVALRSIDYHRPLYPSSYWSRRCDVARL